MVGRLAEEVVKLRLVYYAVIVDFNVDIVEQIAAFGYVLCDTASGRQHRYESKCEQPVTG